MQLSWELATGLAAVLLALVHVLAGHAGWLDRIPRSRWLSFAGGMGLAYVFAHLLPELASHQGRLSERIEVAWLAQREVWIAALAGILGIYAAERFAALRGRRGGIGGATVFWIHVLLIGGYNAIVGYLLHERWERDVVPMLLFAVAMGSHLLVNDHGMRYRHRRLYDRWGRWVLAAAVLAGWAASLVVTLGVVAIATLFGVLAGGITLNVLKEELPEERESSFWSLLLGVVGYGAVLILAS